MGLPATVATGGEASAVLTPLLGWQAARAARAAGKRMRVWFILRFSDVLQIIAVGSRSEPFLGGARDDVQRVHGPAHQRRDRSINQPVTLELRAAAEGLRHQRDTKVTAAARAGVAGVARAVVDYLERGGCEGALQRAAQLRPHRLIPWGVPGRRAAAAGGG